jgi:hypothetical protein
MIARSAHYNKFVKSFKIQLSTLAMFSKPLLFTENSHPIGNRVQGLLRSMQHGEAKWFNTKIATVSQCQFSFSSKNQEEHPTKLHKYCGLIYSLLLLLLVMWLQRRNNLAHTSVGEGLILNSVP